MKKKLYILLKIRIVPSIVLIKKTLGKFPKAFLISTFLAIPLIMCNS